MDGNPSVMCDIGAAKNEDMTHIAINPPGPAYKQPANTLGMWQAGHRMYHTETGAINQLYPTTEPTPGLQCCRQ